MKSRQNRILIFHTHTFFLHCQPDISGRTSNPDFILIYTSCCQNHNFRLFSCFQRHFFKSFQFLKRLIFSSVLRRQIHLNSLFSKNSSRIFYFTGNFNLPVFLLYLCIRIRKCCIGKTVSKTKLRFYLKGFLPEILRWRVQNSLYVSYKRSPAVFRTD